MPLGIQQRSTYNTLNDYLKFTNNEKTSIGSILREIETVQSFSKLLPIKVCTTDKDGDKFVDVGTFEEPYVRNKSSVKTSLDGFGIDATYQTYQRFDYMAYRKSESKIYKYELRMAPREVNLWRISKLGKKARDMAIDMDFDMLYDDAAKNTLNSGVDLMFSVTAACENKEAAYEVLDFLLEDENIQAMLYE